MQRNKSSVSLDPQTVDLVRREITTSPLKIMELPSMAIFPQRQESTKK
ncbi:hypothetical protein ABI_22990 [Asticcacaulis biprosthecium C19]|uniref:Uncharacterized protein n=1 Tax=Asticcacaulis biprosthecium C19 TaxID=715226 RepID=F4QNH9_9CAUL|nr:hypothetical protein ABI_22990 [Asticcacaulis biprosthecium C19]